VNRKSTRSSRRRPRGITLVEALLGTVLLGTLLVAIIVVKGRLTVQAARAEARVQACEALNDLLEGWWPDRESLPRDQAGEVPDRPRWRWQTRRVPNEEADAVRAEIVAVEVFAPDRRDTVPAARVELLLPRGDANASNADHAKKGPDAR